jgi:O-antigen/teichoic acid export membrane protein
MEDHAGPPTRCNHTMTPPQPRSARVLQGLGVQTLGQVLVLAVTFLIVPYTLDTLGEDRFGLWIVAFGTVAYLALADLGLCAVTTREIAQGVGRRESPERLREALERSLHWVVWFSLAGLAFFVMLDYGWGSRLNPEWIPMREPFAAMVIGYLLVFPLSLFASPR